MSNFGCCGSYGDHEKMMHFARTSLVGTEELGESRLEAKCVY